MPKNNGLDLSDGIAVVALIAYLILIFGLIVGYVMNVIDLVRFALSGDPFQTIEVMRVIGLFIFPLGALLGYF
jgi:hypothetical protein